jgi:signal transduction histidine kinase
MCCCRACARTALCYPAWQQPSRLIPSNQRREPKVSNIDQSQIPASLLALSPHDTELERQVAARTADLNELLGHLSTCWDDERRQLARRLHDSLGSSMTALTMHLAVLTKQLPAEQALQERSAQMKTLLSNVINANRELQLSLWNDKLEFLGLKAAISEVVAAFGSSHGLPVRLSLPEEDASYPPIQGVALLRCVEEGLRNVAAHAGASAIHVVLDDNGEQLMLTVRDNGVGPGHAATAPQRCHGLRMLRERAVYLGGTLTLAPASGQGTLLTLTLPRQPG